MANNLITLLFDSASRRKKFWTKGRAVAAVSIMSQLVAVLVTKRPSLAPLHAALTTLLAPTEGRESVEDPNNVGAILQRIRELRGRMTAATQPEQERLKAQVEALVDLVTDHS